MRGIKMGILVDAIYKAFPGLPEMESRTEAVVKEVKDAYNLGNKIVDYVVEKRKYIMNELEKTLDYYLKSLRRSVYNIFENLKKGFAGGEGKEKKREKELQKASKVDNPNLENMVRNTCNQQQEKQEIDAVIKSFRGGCVLSQTNLDSCFEKREQTYIDDCVSVTELYNKGYNTREITREASKNGYIKVNNYKDVIDRVVVGIKQGMTYERPYYNNQIATKLGARDQLIQDYLSGKSYKEIKENLKKNTNGMSISDSSILRIMHDYEKKNREKVVGRRKKQNKKKNNKVKAKKK